MRSGIQSSCLSDRNYFLENVNMFKADIFLVFQPEICPQTKEDRTDWPLCKDKENHNWFHGISKKLQNIFDEENKVDMIMDEWVTERVSAKPPSDSVRKDRQNRDKDRRELEPIVEEDETEM